MYIYIYIYAKHNMMVPRNANSFFGNIRPVIIVCGYIAWGMHYWIGFVSEFIEIKTSAFLADTNFHVIIV